MSAEPVLPPVKTLPLLADVISCKNLMEPLLIINKYISIKFFVVIFRALDLGSAQSLGDFPHERFN
jgi:hypothetical protein